MTGNFKGVWECHIQPNWLLLYLKEIIAEDFSDSKP
ncbi:MAG: type II toxin-antitoxin system YafQ family toxin [Acetatifactor sp.]|nr:type II toxin-antitoxin system YafQ family toxin [Acetatifactor sp.]